MEKDKIKFYDRTIIIGLTLFILSTVSLFVFPEGSFEKDIFIYPWLIVFFIAILCEVILIIGMAVNAFRTKRYIWMLAIIFLGTIFPILFYFFILREEFKEGKESSSKNK